MDKMSQYMFVAALISVGIATVTYVVHAFASRRALVGATDLGSGVGVFTMERSGLPELGGYATTLAVLGLVFLTYSHSSRERS